MLFCSWAPGLDRYAFPNNTAFTLGPGVGYHGVYVQIHYDNRALLSNRTDSSALVFYTIPEQVPTLRVVASVSQCG